MDYLKTLFPLCSTLPDHLRQYTQLTESQILESTSKFDYTILVCDSERPPPIFSGSVGPINYRFNELISNAKEKRESRGELFDKENFGNGRWSYFHKIVGDALFRYFLERAVVFRAFLTTDSPKFMIQIAGRPVFGVGNPVVKQKSTNAVDIVAKSTKKRKPKKKTKRIEEKQLIETNRESVEIIGEVGTILTEAAAKRKRNHRRGKKKKKQRMDTDAAIASTLTTDFAIKLQGISKPESSSIKYFNQKFSNHIASKRYLYSRDLRERFNDASHPIGQAAKSPFDQSLLKNTFGFSDDDLNDFSVRSSIDILIPTLKRWLTLHRRRSKCFATYLDFFCPINCSDVEIDDVESLIADWCPKFRVKRALEAIFSRMVPMELFGVENTSRLLSAVIQFVISAGKFDSTSVHQFATCIKTTKCDWLSKLDGVRLRQHYLLRLLNLVISYLLRIVQSCFYVTESQSEKYQLFFYRKPVWLRISRLAGLRFIERCRLNPIMDEQELHRIKNEKTSAGFFGPFSLRWIPKSGGDVRPIICGVFVEKENDWKKMKRTSTVLEMNQALKPILAVAQYLVRRKPEIMGHSTSDFKDIHAKWKKYVHHVRRTLPKATTKFYIVKADVTGCYDSIDQKLLYSIIENELLADAPDSYSLQGHTAIRSTATSVLCRKFKYAVRSLDKYETFGDMIKRQYSSNGGKTVPKTGMVIVPKGKPDMVTKQMIVNRLRTVIFRRILKISGDRRKYYQTVGIAQGSSLSVLFCNLYLAALERKHLDPILVKDEDLLMRHVDDFLFVTPSLERAQTFSQTVSAGFDDFNCKFRLDKIVTNIDWDLAIADDLAMVVPHTRRARSQCVSWCGLLFDADTLAISMDASRWITGDPRSTLVIDYSKYAPSYVARKVLYYLRTRISTITFDESLNSPKALRNNVKNVIKIVARWYEGYVRAYELCRTVDESAKRRLKAKDFLEEFVKRIYTILKYRMPKAKGVVRMGVIRKAIIGLEVS